MERRLRQGMQVFSRHARYRREARNEIAARNLRLSEAACLLTCGLLLFFYAVTPQIIRGLNICCSSPPCWLCMRWCAWCGGCAGPARR